MLAPSTLNDDSVPTDVMFGCAAVVNVPATKFAVTRLPPPTLPAVTLPVTANDVNVPTEVIFGCAASTTVLAVEA